MKIAITSEYGPDARENIERVNILDADVVPGDCVALDIHHGQMGVGGDASWGMRRLQQHSLGEESHPYVFRLRAFDPSEARVDELIDPVN